MQVLLSAYSYLQQFSLVSVIVRLLLAVVLGGIIGFERERHGRAAGLRTHVLVCVGSAMATLIGHYCLTLADYSGDPLRIGAQVLSGVGFLGAGTIISNGRFQVTGLTTAAGLWATASIGLAVGIGFYEAAAFCAFLVVFTMSILSWVDSRVIRKNKNVHIYMELNSAEAVNEVLSLLSGNFNAKNIQITAPRSSIAGNCGIEARLIIKHKEEVDGVIQQLLENEHVIYALPSA